MDADLGFLEQLGPSLMKVLPMLDERSRRLVLGMAADAEGKGGTGRVAALTGASWQTVANGKAELAAEEELPARRVRRPGGGRKTLAQTDPFSRMLVVNCPPGGRGGRRVPGTA
jgi:hypothetical protein